MKDSTYKKYCLVIDEWFVNGFNGTQAYLKFYPDASTESADSSFREMVGISRIKEYKESKTINTSNKLQITLETQLKRLDDVINDKEERAADKINAIKEQNKLLALYEGHNEQKRESGFSLKDMVNFDKPKQ